MTIEAAGVLMEQIEELEPEFIVIPVEDWLDHEPPTQDKIFTDLFDAGDKVAVIGSSKLRKSFFVMQMALNLAAGRDFLNFQVTKKRIVLIVQLEVKAAHFHRRIKRMAEKLFLGSNAIAGNLFIINGRGIELSIAQIKTAAKKIGAEFILIDPLYKLVDGDENSAHDMKPVLKQFDDLAEATGAAVAYVHHDPKGRPGDRDIRDRGAGSGVLGRDYDACITLTRHRDDADSAIIETLLRNYPPRKPFVASWDDGFFHVSDLPTVAQNSSNAARGSSKPIDEDIDEALNQLVEPVYCQEFDNLLHGRLGLSRERARAVKKTMLLKGLIAKSDRERKKGGGEYIGLPADIVTLNADMAQQKLKYV